MLLYNCNMLLQSRSKNMLPSRRDPNGQERAKSTKQARTEPILPICGNPRVLLHSSLKSASNDTIFRERKARDDFVRQKCKASHRYAQRTIKTPQKAITKAICLFHSHPRAPQRSPLKTTSNDTIDSRKQA